MRVRFPKLLLALAGVPAVGAAQTITPKFAWPAGAKAQAVTEQRTTVSGNAAGQSLLDSTATRTTFSFEVRPSPDGLEIVTGPGVVQRLVASALPQEVDVAAIGAMGGSVIVSRTGEFVRVGNLAALKRRTDSLMAPTFERMRQMAPSMVATMKESISEQAISANAAASFTTHYTSMVGRSWAPGDSATSVTSTPAPFAPGMKMAIPRMLRYDGVVPCSDPARTVCWQFTARSELTRAAMRPALLEMLKQMGMSESMADQVPIPETTTTTTLVVDAGTLLPLRTETRTAGGSNASMIAMLTGTSSITTYTWR